MAGTSDTRYGFSEFEIRPLVQLDRVEELLVVMEKGRGPFSLPGDDLGVPAGELPPPPEADQDGVAGAGEGER